MLFYKLIADCGKCLLGLAIVLFAKSLFVLLEVGCHKRQSVFVFFKGLFHLIYMFKICQVLVQKALSYFSFESFLKIRSGLIIESRLILY